MVHHDWWTALNWCTACLQAPSTGCCTERLFRSWMLQHAAFPYSKPTPINSFPKSILWVNFKYIRTKNWHLWRLYHGLTGFATRKFFLLHFFSGQLILWILVTAVPRLYLSEHKQRNKLSFHCCSAHSPPQSLMQNWRPSKHEFFLSWESSTYMKHFVIFPAAIPFLQWQASFLCSFFNNKPKQNHSTSGLEVLPTYWKHAAVPTRVHIVSEEFDDMVSEINQQRDCSCQVITNT